MNINKKLSVYRRAFVKSIPYYILLLLPITYLIIFKYVPMYGVQIAFRDFKTRLGFYGSPWVGLKHFRTFFNAPSFWQIIGNTLTLSLYSLLMSFPLAVVLAIALNEGKRKFFKKNIQMITYMPYFISTVVLVAMVTQFFDLQVGIVNVFLAGFGIQRQSYTSIASYFPHLYVWSGVWQTTGYSAVIYLAALSGINTELYDAAMVDGANKFRRVINVDLPGIMPTIITLLILNAGAILNVGFEKAYLMQNGTNIRVSEIISTYVYKMGLQNMNYSFSAAVGLFNSIVSLILLTICNFASSRLSETSLW